MSFPYPYFQVQFQIDGTVFQPSEVDALLSGVAAAPNAPTDLFLMSHGWNNNMAEATDLYDALANLLKAQIDANPVLSPRKYAICGVLWPSKKFEDADLIPSGAAALNEAVTTDKLKERVRDLKSLYAASEWTVSQGPPPPQFQQIEDLMDDVEDDPGAQARVVDLLRPLMDPKHATSDDASDRFFETKTATLVQRLSRQVNPPAVVPKGSGAASIDPFSTQKVSGLGGAASFRDVLGGIKSGFLHLLNFSTYYLMKARAGDVGAKGVAPLIVKLRTSRPDLRIHMIGHSFGCRVVASAIQTLPEQEQFRIDTVMLLQGAFSHNGFANEGDGTDRGAFRDVVEKRKVRGPIFITHTRNDKAVGLAYPIASRIAGVNAAELGDENDIFGGLGSNGTQTKDTTTERVMGTLLPAGQQYPFPAGVKPSTPCNLKADQFISGHSDIRKPEVAYAMTIAMTVPAVKTA